MIGKIDHNQIQDVLEKGTPRMSNLSKAEQQKQTDVCLHIDYASLINQALSPENDSLAVEKAKKLIETGQLDTPENIRQAAENIITLGI